MNHLPKILLITFCLTLIPLTAYAQSFGVDLGYSTSEAYIVGGHLISDNFLYRFTVSFQSSATKGAEVSEQKSNYGKTVEGRGDYFISYDFGFGYVIAPKISLTAEISLAGRKYYTNYIDNRFADGGYHMIDDNKFELGFGLGAGYRFANEFGIFIGYNTLRAFSAGITMDFLL
jgi:hypothetical protein